MTSVITWLEAIVGTLPLPLLQELSRDASGSLVVTTTLGALAGGSPSTAITISEKNP